MRTWTHVLGPASSPLQRRLQSPPALPQSCALPWLGKRHGHMGFLVRMLGPGEWPELDSTALRVLCPAPIPTRGGQGCVAWDWDGHVSVAQVIITLRTTPRTWPREWEAAFLAAFFVYNVPTPITVIWKTFWKNTPLFPTLFNSLGPTVSATNDIGGWLSTDPKGASLESPRQAPSLAP